MPPSTAVVLVVFGLWVLASAANLIRPGARGRIPLVERFLGIPTVMLFRLGPVDYQLYYRDELSTGGLTPWRPAIPAPRRTWLSLVWNPSHWFAAAVWYRVRRLTRASMEVGPDQLTRTARYALIRNYVLGLPRDRDSRRRQFVLVRGAVRDRTARAHFTSPLHPL